jgi:hypothetical protein
VNRSDVRGQYRERRSIDLILKLFAEADDVDALVQPGRLRDNSDHFVEDPTGLEASAGDRIALTTWLGFGSG